MYLSARDHKVAVVDSMVKRRWEAEVDAAPLFAAPTLQHRVATWERLTSRRIECHVFDIATNAARLYRLFDDFQPDAVVHYAEQPSAPFSMIDRARTIETQINNISATLNVAYAMKHQGGTCHLIKLGTMGEYGTPNIAIEEGWLDVVHEGRPDRVLFPKRPGSFYHLSKVHDSHNLEFMARVWGLAVTDLNQGVV